MYSRERVEKNPYEYEKRYNYEGYVDRSILLYVHSNAQLVQMRKW